MNAAQPGRITPRPLRTDPVAGTRPAHEIGSRLDEAIALFRSAMPGFGIKLIVPPPLPDGNAGRISMSIWRRGDESAPVHSATSVRETLEHLFAAAIQADRERRDRAGCPLCRGVGWYIAASGIRVLCPHAQKK